VFRGFKTQIVLPVAAIAILLISGGAIAFSVWASQREEAIAEQQVADKVTALQSIFVTTGKLMEDRTHAGLALLVDQIGARGGAERGGPVALSGTTVNDIIVGGRSQAGNFEIVDYVTRLNQGSATLFSKDGPRFVRIATTLKKPDGSRAVGTELDTASKAYAAVSHGQAYYGVADVMGSAYFTGYEPLYARSGELVGVTYVGFKAELPVLSSALDQSRLLQTGFVAVMDDVAVRYLPSWIKRQQAQEHINNQDGSWVVQRTPLAEWGLTIVSAYPLSELQAVSRRIGYGVAIAGVAIAFAIGLVLFLLLDRSVLRLLGGEPREAAGFMRRIAEGDLAVDMGGCDEHPGSLMESLKVMQLKLKNLVSAVRGGAAEVSDQARRFEEAATAFQRMRDELTAKELLRQTKAVGGTLTILEKSIGRFKI
jgi:methyl-accepting chemotaxis protein